MYINLVMSLSPADFLNLLKNAYFAQRYLINLMAFLLIILFGYENCGHSQNASFLSKYTAFFTSMLHENKT